MPIYYPNPIFSTELGAQPTISNIQKTRVMGIVDFGTLIGVPIAESVVVADLDELSLITTLDSDVYLAAKKYFDNTIKNTAQNNTLTIINIGTPSTTSGTASTLTCGVVGDLTDFTNITNGSFAFTLANATQSTDFNILGLDFSESLTLNDVIDIINANVLFSSVAVASLNVDKIVFTSKDTLQGLSFSVLKSATEGESVAGALFLNGESGTIVNGVAGSQDYTSCINNLTNFLTSSPETAPYMIGVNSNLLKATPFEAFLTSALFTNKSTRFVSDYNTLQPSNDPIIQKYLNFSNLLLVKQNSDFEYTYAAVLGRLGRYVASTLYIMNQTALSPIIGVESANLKSSQQQTFKANNFNYVQTQSPSNPINSLQLGVFMNGVPYTDYYGPETTKNIVDDALNNFIYQANNSTTFVLKYNTQGLNSLLAHIVTNLNNCKSFGLIDDYANLTFVPFADYITANPDDFARGIYNGFSVEVRLAKFFTKITLFAKFGLGVE